MELQITLRPSSVWKAMRLAWGPQTIQTSSEFLENSSVWDRKGNRKRDHQFSSLFFSIPFSLFPFNNKNAVSVASSKNTCRVCVFFRLSFKNLFNFEIFPLETHPPL